MNNERYNQIIDEAYENYVNWWEYSDDSVNLSDEEFEKWLKLVDGGLQWSVLSKEEFISKCKTDDECAKKWGLKIEERELSLEERAKLLTIKIGHEIKETSLHGEGQFETEVTQDANAFNIPTKLLTVTYNNETVEVYE